MTTGKLQGDFDLCIIFALNISSMASSITFLLFNGVRLGLNLIGGLSHVFIFILTIRYDSVPNLSAQINQRWP